MSHRLADTTGCATGKRVPVRRLPNPSPHHDFGLRGLGGIARDPLFPAHLHNKAFDVEHVARLVRQSCLPPTSVPIFRR